MVGHEADEHVDVVVHKSHARTDVGNDLHPDLGVIAGETLADVVQERTDDEKIGTIDATGSLACVRGRLHQVPIDGEAVVRVALRLALHARPLGQHPHPQTDLVQRLDDRDGAMPRQQQFDRTARAAGGQGDGKGGRSSPRRARVSRANGASWVTDAVAACSPSDTSGSSSTESTLTSPSRRNKPGRMVRSRRASRPIGPRSDERTRCHMSSLAQARRRGSGDRAHQCVGILEIDAAATAS